MAHSFINNKVIKNRHNFSLIGNWGVYRKADTGEKTMKNKFIITVTIAIWDQFNVFWKHTTKSKWSEKGIEVA